MSVNSFNQFSSIVTSRRNKMIIKSVPILLIILPLSLCLPYEIPKENIHITTCDFDDHNTLQFLCSRNYTDTNFFAQTPSAYCENVEAIKDKVKKIVFSRCNLSSLPTDLFAVYKNVAQVRIEVSGLKKLNENTFIGANALDGLFVQYNELTEIPEYLFRYAPNIENIDFSRNNINRIDLTAFNNIAKVRSLSLSQNQITSLPDRMFASFKKECTVHLENNKIRQIDATTFADGSAIVRMDLSFNEIVTVKPHAFDDLINLEYLVMSHNPIKQLDTELFAHANKLETLDLNHMELSIIDFSTFSRILKLKRLDLSFNKLTRVQFDRVLIPLHNLYALRLYGNQLTSLEGLRAVMIPRLKFFGIAQNNFTCSYLYKFFSEDEWKDDNRNFTHPDPDNSERARASYSECYGYPTDFPDRDMDSWSVEDFGFKED